MNPLPGQKTVVRITLGDEIVGYENENDFRPGDGEGGGSGGGGGGKSRRTLCDFFPDALIHTGNCRRLPCLRCLSAKRYSLKQVAA